MITRENVCIEWNSWHNLKCVVPIPVIILNACPIYNETNLKACYESLNESLNYENLKSAMLYELNLRKKIYNKIAKNYNPKIRYNESLEILFDELKINIETQKGFAFMARNMMDYYHVEITQNFNENETIKKWLDCSYKQYINPKYSNIIQKTLDSYLSLKPIKKNPKIIDNYIFKFLTHENDRNFFLIRFAFKDKINFEEKEINLMGFKPDIGDYRNVLLTNVLEDYGKYSTNLNDLNKEEYSNQLFYNNPGR
ncbi:MAG: hypothetical protein PHN56_02215, partial [Candidatus Nanoarchaeia archaeon]|nr:hypothetical protein [Candidatus Nanoarchaeia archaeon]